jgi:hypothetical protein
MDGDGEEDEKGKKCWHMGPSAVDLGLQFYFMGSISSRQTVNQFSSPIIRVFKVQQMCNMLELL